MVALRLALILALHCLAVPCTRGAVETVDMLSRNWTTRDGLPQDRIRAVTRTRDGYLWLGTEAGLARFDGFGFKNYGLHDGLSAAVVLSLLETSDGTLWVGTLGGGITALRDGKVVRTYTRADGLETESISFLAEDGEGRLWAGERDSVLRLAGDRFEALPGAKEVRKGWLQSIFRSRDGALWLSFAGSSVWTWKGGKWTPIKFPGKDSLTAWCEDQAGRLWAGDSAGGVWCREDGQWRMVPVPGERKVRVHSMTAAQDGTVWLAWYRQGLMGFKDDLQVRPSSEGEPYVGLEEVVYATPDGQLWLGCSTRGLFALAPSHLETMHLDAEDRPGADIIGGLLEVAPGEFLIGTQGRGLFRKSKDREERIDIAPELGASEFVNCMIPARDGGVWVGSGSGLVRLNGGRVERPRGKLPTWFSVWELCETKEGLWIGTGSGELFRVVAGNARAADFSIGVPVKGMASQADGTLWLGTRGQGVFAGKEGAWPSYGKEQGLPSQVVRVVHSTPQNDLWVGTSGGGLSLKRDDGFFTVTTRDGLPDDTISQIHQDPAGRLWLGTNRGLAILSADEVARIKSGKPGRLYPRVIDRFDGLVSEEFTIVPPVVMSDGRLAFATTQGIALLKPEDFEADQSVPPVVLEEVLIDGRATAANGGTIEVPPGAKRVEFRFTGLHFAAPDRLRFRNRLGGLEDEWGEPGTDRTATYRNVAPGHYTFEVSATTGNGLWGATPAAVKLHFRPHVWQTGWFRALVLLGGVAGLVLLVRRREQKRAARRIEELERQQAVDGERARIARDLHDDVGASLTQVALLSQLARGNLTKRPERAGQHVQQIFDTAKEVTRALDEIVWAVNPQNDTLESFALFLGAFVQNYSHAAGLRCRIEVPESLPAVAMEPTVRHHLYLATKEILHNVAKHADASEVRLVLNLESGGFRLMIEDDGRGFDLGAEGKPEADGLLNLQSRLKQLGGTCTRQSAPGQGTRVEMQVPLASGV